MKKKKSTFVRAATPSPGTMDSTTGSFDQQATFHFLIPAQFILLCKLIQVPPQQMLIDFMDDLSQGSWRSEGRKESRQLLRQYFIAHQYGAGLFSGGELSSIFEELAAIGLLFPAGAPLPVIEMHESWRAQYQRYWFEKWRRNDTP